MTDQEKQIHWREIAIQIRAIWPVPVKVTIIEGPGSGITVAGYNGYTVNGSKKQQSIALAAEIDDFLEQDCGFANPGVLVQVNYPVPSPASPPPPQLPPAPPPITPPLPPTTPPTPNDYLEIA